MRSRRHRSLRDLERRKPIGLFILAGFLILGLFVFFSYRAMKALFVLERIIIKGNEILSEEDIKRIAGLVGRMSLIDVSGFEVYHRLISSPWIKEAVVRKAIPDRLIIWIEEARPEAVIRKEGRLYLIDDGGVILEEIHEDSPLMLPILEIDYEDKELLMEALLLLKEMKRLNITLGDGNIIVRGSRKEDLTILLMKADSMDQVLIKVGYGGYDEKLRRLIDFAPSIRQRTKKPSIIDLRFEGKVIVKENIQDGPWDKLP